MLAPDGGHIVTNKHNFWIAPKTKNQYFVGVQYPEGDMKSVETLLNVPVTRPNVEVVISVPGVLNSGVFVRLKLSQRNSNCHRSVILKSLNSERLKSDLCPKTAIHPIPQKFSGRVRGR